MKLLFKTIFTIITAVVVLIAFLYFYTGGMTNVAEDFFESVKTDKSEDTNNYLSQYIAQDSAKLYQYLKENAMNNVQSSAWHTRHFVNNRGSIAGEITNTQGTSISTRMDFIKESGDWKIYAIEKQSPKASLKPSEPSNQHQQTLVSNSMSNFMQAAKRKSMKSFHQTTSALWQAQTTVSELDTAFAAIYNFQGDYDLLSNITPTIESALIDENNLLVINGFFPINSTRISVNQKYIYEATEWKLFAFSYNAEKI